MAKQFEQRLDYELAESKPEVLEDENLAAFQMFIDTIDMVTMKKSEEPLTEGKKFAIESISEEVTVKKGRIGREIVEEKPATRLKITFGPEFSLGDVPDLVKGIEEYHNRAPESLESGVLLDACQAAGQNYLFWAKELESFRSQTTEDPRYKEKIPIAAQKHFDDYLKQLLKISQSYQPELFEGRDVSDLTPEELRACLAEIDINRLKQVSLWTKGPEGQAALKRWEEARDSILAKYPDKIERALGLIDHLVVIPAVKESLEENIEQAIFLRGEKQMWQLSDVPEVFKGEFNHKIIRDYFQEFFGRQWQDLEGLQVSLRTAKEKGNPAEISEIQLKIARKTCEIVYSEKFWKYKRGHYEISGVRQKEVNCMARAAIIRNVFKNFFGEETLGGVLITHFFPAFRLADGKHVILDQYPPIITTDIKESVGIQPISGGGYAWYCLGPHEKMYRAAIWNWLGKTKNSLFCWHRAIEACPYHPTYYNGLAYQIFKTASEKGNPSPEELGQAEKMFLRASELAPADPDLHADLGWFYRKIGNLEKSLDEYLIAAILLNENPKLLTVISREAINAAVSQLEKETWKVA